MSNLPDLLWQPELHLLLVGKSLPKVELAKLQHFSTVNVHQSTIAIAASQVLFIALLRLLEQTRMPPFTLPFV